MKLSEILGWKEPECTCSLTYCECVFTNFTSCDREIDREALANIIYKAEKLSSFYYDRADYIISTMPTWLKRSDGK